MKIRTRTEFERLLQGHGVRSGEALIEAEAIGVLHQGAGHIESAAFALRELLTCLTHHLQQAAEHGVRHREMFWNPTPHMACGVPYETALDGIIDGVRDARTDFGIQCFLIAAINRMGTPERGLEMVQTVLDHPREEVVGIGMDYAEADNPPEKFWKAYRLAGERGLRRTAHASEDARITERCADQGVVFSCCPRSTA